MFSDSLTFSVDAIYAAQAFCGVPSIVDDCYYRTIFCWHFKFALSAPWQQANSPKQKSVHFDIYFEKWTHSLMTYGLRD